MFIPEEKHDGHRVVQLVHALEVKHLVQIAEVDNCKVLHSICDAIQDFFLLHTVRIRVAPEANHNESIFFA